MSEIKFLEKRCTGMYQPLTTQRKSKSELICKFHFAVVAATGGLLACSRLVAEQCQVLSPAAGKCRSLSLCFGGAQKPKEGDRKLPGQKYH